ncbi:MAG: hypothetical protein N3A54_05860, partial [Patescibacteria group bacterium]|nr:hypothetical protein [Patescibacteria group bacterium]
EKYSVCNTVDTDVPIVSFTKLTPYEYKYSLNLRDVQNPFLLILQTNYHKTWNLYINGRVLQPILVNGYANGWIIDPKEKNLQGEIRGTIRLGFQRYFVIGRFLSSIGMFTVFIFLAKSLWLKEF